MPTPAEILRRASDFDSMNKIAKDFKQVESGLSESEKEDFAKVYSEKYEEFTRPLEPPTLREVEILGGVIVLFLLMIFSNYF